jgi:oxygen-independent coproporphyrinogen-3 oxidase
MLKEFFEKKVPFYTLYPTQSNWVKSQNHNLFFENLKNFTNSMSSISMYLHFPFCPKQCYFCHCYTVISKKKDHYDKISLSIYKELQHLFKTINNKKLKITDVHFGGGTPTVMPLEYFEKICGIIKDNVDEKYLKEIALEVDPRNDMSTDKLINYSNYGVNRLSIGVQDFEDEVQKAINRVNSYDLIKNLLNSKVREIYKSINFDFIFGLPKQTLKSLENTTKKIVELKPNRITLLNMDHRPDIYKHQKAYDQKDLPSNELKLEMYNMCSEILSSSNYNKIGVNHFALGDDILSKYKSEKKLYRNPNGFSPGWAYDMISVGPSATGKLGNYYYQNVYSIDKYIETVSKGIFPVSREKTLTSDDKKRRKIIMDLLNFEEINVNELSNLGLNQDNIMKSLNHFCKKGFLEFNDKENIYKVSELGNYFVNHICNVFDEYNQNQYQSQREFNDGLRSLDRNLNLNNINE